MKNIFVLLITALVTFSCASQSNKQILPDAYLKESNQTRDFLKRSFSSIPEGAAFKTPVDEIKVFDANRPGDDLIASAEEHKSWNSHSYYHFVLDLSDMKLVSYTQNASYTTTASILLDYYFSGLADLGYKTAGELHTMIFYPAQFASSTWFNQFCNIIITGSVYINVEYKTAMVSVDISEIY